MIIQCDVTIKDILAQGKKFIWKKPSRCFECEDTVLWGHGFVLCYFSCVDEGIYLKRYRCPCCGVVIKMKPKGYFKKIRTSIKIIKKSLEIRLNQKMFIPDISRETQHHWLANLKQNIKACLGENFKNRLLEGFQKLIDMKIIPVSSTVQSLGICTVLPTLPNTFIEYQT